jgi:hypothetical protein
VGRGCGRKGKRRESRVKEREREVSKAFRSVGLKFDNESDRRIDKQVVYAREVEGRKSKVGFRLRDDLLFKEGW